MRKEIEMEGEWSISSQKDQNHLNSHDAILIISFYFLQISLNANYGFHFFL